MNNSSDEGNKVMEDKSEQNLAEGTPQKGKSCKGYLYYSSILISKEKNPRCIGIPRQIQIQKVPNYVSGESEAAASKDGSTLANFYYGCLGYSVYMTGKDNSSMKPSSKKQLPFCVGLEVRLSLLSNKGNDSSWLLLCTLCVLYIFLLLVDKRAASAGASAPSNAHQKEDARGIPQPRPHRPAPSSSSGDDFFHRFTRNANLVAAGVAKNMKRVGNHIKETVNDILYPYRKRPK